MARLVADNMMIWEMSGWHDDGWCNRQFRGRAKVTAPGNIFYAEVGIKSEPGNDSPTALSLTLDDGVPKSFIIQRRVPTLMELERPENFELGQDFSFLLDCENIVTPTGRERRQLSFVLIRVGIR
jgi:hypothetical protein